MSKQVHVCGLARGLGIGMSCRVRLRSPQDVRIKEGVVAAMGGDLQEDEEEAPPQKQQPAGPRPAAAKKSEEPPKELTPEEKEAETLKQKGNELYKQKKFQEALEAYDEAIAKNPKEILYLNNKAGGLAQTFSAVFSALMMVCSYVSRLSLRERGRIGAHA